MPNLTGGKNYKKSKQTGSISRPFLERAEDQLYARILRNLGGRNMLVYCNDNKVRLCHICGAMKKFNWLNAGDLVLISLRGFEKKVEDSSKDKYEKGDILAKYDQEHYSRLKKMPDVNQRLFMQLETMDGKILAEIGDKEEEKVRHLLPTEDTGGIEFDRDATKKEEVEEDENKEIDIDDI
jgi:translation initiation factor 1A